MRFRAPRRFPAPLLLALGVLSALLVRLPARGAEPAPRVVGFVDLHADLAYQHVFRGAPFAGASAQYSAAELLRAGVVGVVLPLFVPHSVSPSGPRDVDLERSYRSVYDALIRTPPFALPGCLAPPGTVRTWLGFEGAAPLAERPDELVGWVARGVRSVGLVHTRDNALATSSGAAHKKGQGGLADAGRALVRKAHELNVAVDVSHASSEALRDVVAEARAVGLPVIATHSNARALADHPRNLSDAELRAIASTGGLVGINFHSPFLNRARAASLDDVVRHVRHVVRVVGVQHVAFGSDFEGDIRPPSGLSDVRALPKLAAALEASGLSRDEVEQIFGKNALRVLCRRSPWRGRKPGVRVPRRKRRP